MPAFSETPGRHIRRSPLHTERRWVCVCRLSCRRLVIEAGIVRLTRAQAPADGSQDGTGGAQGILTFELSAAAASTGQRLDDCRVSRPRRFSGRVFRRCRHRVSLVLLPFLDAELRPSGNERHRKGTEKAPAQQNVRTPGRGIVFYVLSCSLPPNSSAHGSGT
jgi:hypothetical protein